MLPRLHAVRQACQVPADHRSEEHINDILEFVKDVTFFSELTEMQQRGLCRTMTTEVFGPREVVFEMGEVGDKFYIVLMGSVIVQVPDLNAPCPNGIHARQDCDCPNRVLDARIRCERGRGFGEIALQRDEPRSATITTNEKTELLVVKRSDYDRFAGQHHRHFIEQRVKFLRQCPRIEEALRNQLVSPQDIAAMANCLSESHLSGSALACKQGDMADRMIFVRSGRLVQVRTVDLDRGHPECDPRRRGALHSMEQMPNSQHRGSVASRSFKAMMATMQKERHARLQEMAAGGQPGEFTEPSSPTGEPSSPKAGSPGGATGNILTRPGVIASGQASDEPQNSAQAKKSKVQSPAQAQGVSRPDTIESSAPSTSSQFKRRRLLRIGTIGPYQYYGDRQLCIGEKYPVSLVSDPVAEIYVMSKHDILRRLPKKMLSALFTDREEVLPSDDQLLQMNRQTERWNQFRRGMHAEALSHRGQVPSRGPREPAAASRISAADKLEFLGVSADSAIARQVLPLPTPQTTSLTDREQEHFSDSSARFLRKVKALKKDSGLRNALARAGWACQSRLGDLLSEDDPDDQRDPLQFWFEEYWSKLVTDPVGLDIDAALNAEEAPKPGATPSRVGGTSTPRNFRRGSSIADSEGSGSPGPGLSQAGLRLPAVRSCSSSKSSTGWASQRGKAAVPG